MLDGADFLARHLFGERGQVDGFVNAAAGVAGHAPGGIFLAGTNLLLQRGAGLGLAGNVADLGLDFVAGGPVGVVGLVAAVHAVGTPSGTARGPVAVGRGQCAAAALVVAAAGGAIGAGGGADRTADGAAGLSGSGGGQQQERGAQQMSGAEGSPFGVRSQGITSGVRHCPKEHHPGTETTERCGHQAAPSI